jgi:threonine dehydrogenase-like Zn-dependent dehydrogenase
VVALDVADATLELARLCGAGTSNIDEGGPAQTIRELTGGYGTDVHPEGTGHPGAVPRELKPLRKLGMSYPRRSA